jgi:protein-S-isoprenylcysteine O-methyltransferase Ste14
MKKQMPPFYFYSFIILEIVAHFSIPIYKLNIIPFNFLGILIIFFGLWVNLSSKKMVLKNETTIIPFEKSEKLVTQGIFNFTRNPMYLGMLLILIGEAVILSSISPVIIAITFIPLIKLKYIDHEERLLEETFRDEYLTYKNRVRRWV